MVFPSINVGSMYKHLKGNLKIGGINLDYDFTDGLDEESWIRRQEYRETGMYITKSGKIIIPKMGIY